MTVSPRFLPFEALVPACLCFCAGLASANPAAQLQCWVTYAGTTHTVLAETVQDPYPVPSVDIGGRFRFKAVMVGEAHRLDYVKLYAYLETPRQPVLIQQATYLPPFRVTPVPYLLTGEQRLYAGPVERELQYRCTLEGLAP